MMGLWKGISEWLSLLELEIRVCKCVKKSKQSNRIRVFVCM